jgi:dihydroxy-acid dehydratase
MLAGGGPLPRDLVTRKSLENAAAVVAATGGSTNAGLHLPAIAHEAGIHFTLDDAAEVFARTPLLADLQPAGRYLAADVFAVGGTDAVLKALLDAGHLHGDTLTLSGQTMAEHLAHHSGPDGEVVRPASAPVSSASGLVVLRGSLAPDGALIKSPVSSNFCSRATPVCLKAKKRAVLRSSNGAMARAMYWSFATRVRAADPACARCSASPR